jgi:hypothetical protein
MEAHKEQGIDSGWLIAFFLLIIVLLFTFGDVLTGIVGILIQGAIFAGYHNELHKEI